MAQIIIDQQDKIEYKDYNGETLGLIYRVINKDTGEKGGYVSLTVRISEDSWVEEGAVIFHINDNSPATTFNLNSTIVKRGSNIKSHRAAVLVGCEIEGILRMGVSEDFALEDPIIPIRLDNVRIRGNSRLSLFGEGLVEVIDVCLEKEAAVELTEFESIIINDMYIESSDLELSGHQEHIVRLMIDGFGLKDSCLFQGEWLYRDLMISDVHFSGDVDVKLIEEYEDDELGGMIMTGIKYTDTAKHVNIQLDEKNILINEIK